MKVRKYGALMGICFATLACTSFLLTPACANEEAAVGRRILRKWQDTVVTVKLSIETRMVVEGREVSKRETKTEVTATVIDPSGLAVLSLSATDPTKIFSQMELGGDEYSFKWESKITDVRIRLSDGREVPARVVLRDEDLDLAFVRPAEKFSKPIPALNLSRHVRLKILDQIVVLTRLGRVAGWAPSVSMGRIQAIVRKPRTFYVPGLATMEGGLGSPVFALNGKVVGVLLLRVMRARGAGLGAMFGGMGGMGILPVILPAADILEVAKQAP